MIFLDHPPKVTDPAVKKKTLNCFLAMLEDIANGEYGSVTEELRSKILDTHDRISKENVNG